LRAQQHTLCFFLNLSVQTYIIESHKSFGFSSQSEPGRVDQTQIWVDQTQIWVDQTQIWVDQTQIWVDQTQIWVDQTKIWVDQTQIWVDQTQIWVDQTQIWVDQTQIWVDQVQSPNASSSGLFSTDCCNNQKQYMSLFQSSVRASNTPTPISWT
jgi:urease accessory protein UreH